MEPRRTSPRLSKSSESRHSVDASENNDVSEKKAGATENKLTDRERRAVDGHKGLYPSLPDEVEPLPSDVKTPKKPSLSRRGLHSTSAKKVDKKSEKTQSSQASHSNSSTFGWLWVAALVLLLGVLILPCCRTVHEDTGEDNAEGKLTTAEVESALVRGLMRMRDRYPAQAEQFWRTVRSQLRRLVREGAASRQPVVLLLAHAPQQRRLARCITREILSVYLQAHQSRNQSVILNMEAMTSQGLSSDDVKLQMDDQLHAGLRSGRTAVIYDVDRIPGRAALLLHGYCDNENAPYKTLVLVLTQTIQKPKALNENYRHNLRKITQELEDAWGQELVADTHIIPLMSRVANNAVHLRPEGPRIEEQC